MTDSNDRPVVLVHGFGGSAAETWQSNGWMDLIADAGRTPIGIDILGHGEADKPHDPAAYQDMHRRLFERFPDEGQVDAIGFSLGARLLLQCAIEAPERFGRLVLTGVGRNLFEPDERSLAIRDAINGVGDTTDPFIRYFADLAEDPNADIDALRALIGNERDPLRPESLAPVTMPVLVLLGDGDFAGPAEPLLDALPQAQFSELKRCDHFATPRSMQCLDEALAFVDASPF